MKKHNIIITLTLLLVAALFLYIELSSSIIDEDYYRQLAWEISKQDKTIVDWKSGHVSVVNTGKHRIHVANTASSKINYSLLILNGRRVVRVEFRTTQDGLLGPIVLYFNPFTKQCIGGDLRM